MSSTRVWNCLFKLYDFQLTLDPCYRIETVPLSPQQSRADTLNWRHDRVFDDVERQQRRFEQSSISLYRKATESRDSNDDQSVWPPFSAEFTRELLYRSNIAIKNQQQFWCWSISSATTSGLLSVTDAAFYSFSSTARNTSRHMAHPSHESFFLCVCVSFNSKRTRKKNSLVKMKTTWTTSVGSSTSQSRRVVRDRVSRGWIDPPPRYTQWWIRQRQLEAATEMTQHRR